MKHKAVEAFARRASEAKVVASEFDALCRSEAVTDLALFDALAKHIAIGYNTSNWSFQQADTAMNNLWAFLTSRVKRDDWEIPKYFYDVYEAFDAGEYQHSGDAKSVDPQEKYTKSLIAELAAKK